jgi:hypothetical protein
MFYNKRIIRFTAKVLLVTMTCQLVFPAASFALTSGPSQPEVQSFEPVGTTDMVDMFTGDFVYNIPLLDVEGYPVNISYHSGGDMEQEASWVGLGWNINPGVINRSVRGMPDDFNGETITKKLNIKEERNVRMGLGVGIEPAGVGQPYLSLGLGLGGSLNISNYRGVSADFNISASAGVNVLPRVSAGINLGVSSQGGADIDYNVSASLSSSQIVSSSVGAEIGLGIGHGYNSRTSVKDKSFGIFTGVSIGGRSLTGPSFSTTIPVAIRNYIPVITNSSKMLTLKGQIKLGGEFLWTLGHISAFGMMSKLQYSSEGSRAGYGYLYAQNGNDNAIMDFTRDKDGMYNETMNFLPLGNMTYDVYSVSGQGTGGSFRPFRNDFGSVFDPVVSSTSDNFSLNLEAGIGNLFSIGGDGTASSTDVTSGPWQDYQRPFKSREAGSTFENTYFKQAGELTSVDPSFFSSINGLAPVSGTESLGLPLIKPNSDKKRDPRANLIYYFTGDEASGYGVASSQKLYSYTSTNGFATGADAMRDTIDRVDANTRKSHHLSEIVQVQTDGRRYVYGLPAMNKTQKEMTFAVANTSSSEVLSSGQITYQSGDNSLGNGKGRDNFYSLTETPAFAHSYLLTSVLSTDYVDITGNGPTDDDFGSFTKFNYTRKETDYKWRAPYTANTAQYQPGFKSDKLDDKASYLEGSREQWIVHSIESKNFISEFYTSARLDAKGADQQGSSYKLDSIKLYNKHDRFINKTNAVPVKTVIFTYDYSLCKHVANNSYWLANISNPSRIEDNTGKLTLKKIAIRYGNSDKSMISPYQFEYGSNYNYDIAAKDRWGAYKPNDPQMPNAEYPFVKQTDPNLDQYAGAWSLNKIILPSGGAINVTYEADDYAYVQDKVAMEMFALNGVGSTANFSSGNQLYFDKNNPNQYYYFTRRTQSEKPGIPFGQNYLKDKILYCNFDTRIVDNAYEPIKGYVEVEEIGACSDGIHGYLKVKTIEPKGGGAYINPSTYTAINFARYYLPHVIFPGNNSDVSDIGNVLSGLRYAFGELLSIGKNPVKRMVEEGKAKDVKLATSILRLNSPGMKKKGGGQRVKKLEFYDNWSKLAGGDAQDATYGKTYDYTTEDQGSYGTISSGVASYEPLIGGDENPLRTPVDYTAQKASNWPPNDPVGLYQEMPLGESLYPGPIVGYSRVTVRSIHQQAGRSAQGLDIYDFYTAKDFPIQVNHTPKQVMEDSRKYGFTKQEANYKVTQGFSLVFNDMHGKPKRTEHRVIKPTATSAESELVSYQQYNYNVQGGKLSNTVPVMVFDAAAGKMKKVDRQLGIEADMTVDTREKKEHTSTETWAGNLNVTAIGIFPIPVPLVYPWYGSYDNNFNSVVATKVVQQYGILMSVESAQEGALTTMRNEAFDPLTGQPLITSVNNEFREREYSVNYPAYWGYKSMGPSYVNTGYTDKFASLEISNYSVNLPNVSSENYKIGDELLVSYTLNGQPQSNNVWVTGAYTIDANRTTVKCRDYYTPEMLSGNDTITVNPDTLSFYHQDPVIPGLPPPPPGWTEETWGSCGNLTLILKPRFKYSWPQTGTLKNVNVKVIRSGAKNQLNESIQSYTGMDKPLDDNGIMKDNLTKLINISAREFSDTLTAILPRFDPLVNPTYWDTMNIYVNGTRQVKRLSKEYAYLKNREYNNTTARNAGLFSALSLWRLSNHSDDCVIEEEKYCICNSLGVVVLPGVVDPDAVVYRYTPHYPSVYTGDFNLLSPQPAGDKNWVTARSITKWSPWGHEIENKDAIGNFTAAMYGYNNQLPVALAQNAQQHEMFAESFEDYQQLSIMSNFARMSFAPFNNFFTLQALAGSAAYGMYSLFGTSNYSLTTDVAHSGNYALLTPASFTLNLPVKASPVPAGQARYLPFTLQNGKQYVVSYWYRPKTITGVPNAYTPPANVQNKSNIIEGWQQAEGVITVPASGTTYSLGLPLNTYIDDIRILPVDANMKSFVYHPVNQKLIATLDENNFASFYEYDQEGNLVRTKKETEKGIITVMESRSANAKKSN